MPLPHALCISSIWQLLSYVHPEFRQLLKLIKLIELKESRSLWLTARPSEVTTWTWGWHLKWAQCCGTECSSCGTWGQLQVDRVRRKWNCRTPSSCQRTSGHEERTHVPEPVSESRRRHISADRMAERALWCTSSKKNFMPTEQLP